MEMRVSLWNEQYAENNDLIYFPGSIIPGGDWQNITLFTNPTNIVFPEIQNPLQVVWLVMELTTPITGKYISPPKVVGRTVSIIILLFMGMNIGKVYFQQVLPVR